MSDENETEHSEETSVAAKANIESDDYVEARFSVAVIPGENVSAHFVASPKDPKNAITSVSLSFVEKKHGVVTHSFAGATVQEKIAPRPGQGAMGDSGVDVAVFSGSRGDDHADAEDDAADIAGELFAVLAGTVSTEEEPRSFFFSRQFYL